MSKILPSLIFTLLFSILATAQPKEPQINIDKNITVTGKVIDKDNKLPLEYASVAFFSKSENKIVDGGITDANGNFSITIKNGVYDISVE